MKSYKAITTIIGLVLLAACAARNGLPAIGVPAVPSLALEPRATSSYKVLHRFQTVPDGAHPDAGLLLYNGVLYGTTEYGGANFGTVYEMSPDGAESVLYTF